MHFNKLFIAFTIISISSFSQTITIRDISTREPIEKVILQDKKNKQVFTDLKGKADISVLNKDDSIFIFLFGCGGVSSM